jgi:peroxiredoxin
MKHFVAIFFLGSMAVGCSNTSTEADKDGQTSANSMSELETDQVTLKSKLGQRKKAFSGKADSTKKRVYAEGIESVRTSGILDSAIQVGDRAPEFTLYNAVGEKRSLSDYLKTGPVVLTWYRGGWCPYCNLTLRYLQKELPKFKAEGANLIALTPELPDKSLNTKEKNELAFEVLSDTGNHVANEYGIVFKLTPEVAKYYNDGFGLSDYNGNTSNELPLAATYVIDTNGKVIYSFLDADYRNRAEPSEITAVLKKNE